MDRCSKLVGRYYSTICSAAVSDFGDRTRVSCVYYCVFGDGVVCLQSLVLGSRQKRRAIEEVAVGNEVQSVVRVADGGAWQR